MSKLTVKLIFGLIRLIFRDKTNLILANLALRHQLEALKRKKSQKLKKADRRFLAWLFKIWDHWKFALIVVKQLGLKYTTIQAPNILIESS